MRAVVCKELTGPNGLVVADLPVPVPGPGEVLVRVRAAGVNFADGLIIRGQYQERPQLPFVPGMEIAGEVEAAGAGVTGWAPGTPVLASLAHGAFAEAVVVAERDLVRLPAGLDLITAAGFPIAYGTAHGALAWAARLCPGETLVVHGAGGGVGLATVECGKAMGARVIATARGGAHLEAARAHGADHLIDTAKEDVRLRIKALTDQVGADVVLDPIGGELLLASLRALAWSGRLLVIGFASGDIPAIPANRLLIKNAAAIGFYWGSYRARDPARVRASFATLLGWWAEGKLRPHVSHRLPLAQAAEALELLRARQSIGKIVLTME